MDNSITKVHIEDSGIIDNNYVDQYGNTWSTLRLIEASKEYKVFKLPLIGIDLSRSPWSIDNINDCIRHFNIVKSVKLKYPIILDSDGIIADGWHRIVKAILEGKLFIDAIRIENMPTKDSYSAPTN